MSHGAATVGKSGASSEVEHRITTPTAIPLLGIHPEEPRAGTQIAVCPCPQQHHPNIRQRMNGEIKCRLSLQCSIITQPSKRMNEPKWRATQKDKHHRFRLHEVPKRGKLRDAEQTCVARSWGAGWGGGWLPSTSFCSCCCRSSGILKVVDTLYLFSTKLYTYKWLKETLLPGYFTTQTKLKPAGVN